MSDYEKPALVDMSEDYATVDATFLVPVAAVGVFVVAYGAVAVGAFAVAMGSAVATALAAGAVAVHVVAAAHTVTFTTAV